MVLGAASAHRLRAVGVSLSWYSPPTMKSERRIEMVPLDKILPAKKNPKTHDLPSIMASMALNGFGEAPMVDGRTGRLVAGHGRVEALQALAKEKKPPPRGVVEAKGKWLVPIQTGWESRNDAEASAYIIASNRITELGGWDEDQLAALLWELAGKGGVGFLEAAGYDPGELDRVIKNTSREISEDEIGPGEHKCPKCGFKFD